MISIVCADDHHIVRQGLRALLEAEADFRVVGEASDGSQAVSLVKSLLSDVLVVDLMMPGLGGLEVIHELRQSSSATKIVVLSMHQDHSYVTQALSGGASAYVLKESNARDLVDAVRKVVAGERYLSPPLSEENLRLYGQKTQQNGLDMYDTLTAREREVLLLTAQGHSSTAIAKQLYISARTVETHRANLMRKLGLHLQAELIHYAIKRGLL